MRSRIEEDMLHTKVLRLTERAKGTIHGASPEGRGEWRTAQHQCPCDTFSLQTAGVSGSDLNHRDGNNISLFDSPRIK
jgi:hypothetical protein